MSPYRRNILVGVTVLGSILVLGWMFLRFSSKTVEVFAPPQILVHFKSTRADGLSDGSAVFYLGVAAGRVSVVRRSPDAEGVLIDAVIDRNPPLPANVRAVISSSNALGGSSALNLDVDGEKPHGELQANSTIEAKYVGLQLNFLSPQFTEAAVQIGAMSDEIRKTAQQLRESGAIKDMDTTIQQIRETANKASLVMDSLNKTVGDPKTTEDIRAAVANIRAATDNAAKVAAKMDALTDKLSKNSDDVSVTLKTTRGHIDDVSKQLGDRLTQISTVLANVQDITEKIDKGKGTAGQLMNDPRLYEALVDSSRELNATVADLHRLVQQWEQEGVSFKLK